MNGEYAACAAPEPAETCPRPLTDCKGLSISHSVGHCEEHYDAETAGTCRDCRRHLCGPCLVEVRRLGTLCKPCALVRAGVRTGRRVS
jgi:hypothetical protein